MLTLLATATLSLGGADEPLRVFLRGGPKTHGPGQHEHALFVDEWTQLLRERGAVVEGGLSFPSAEQLSRADVLVIYAAEGASIHGQERERFDAFRARGGGLVVLHDGVCGDDASWFAGVAGGAWRHGQARWKEGLVDLHVVDREHPITRGLASFRFDDEIYYDLELDPRARVLVRGFHSVFDASPQAWTLEQGPARSFVSIQGHEWRSFSHPAWRALVLRGIAWAGKRDDVDLLVSGAELAQLAYPPGGPLAPARAHEALVGHPEFRLSLVAAEPLVEKPISIEWDARGRAWVALTPGYPDKERFSGVAAHDEIAVLEDTDGDGALDARHTYFRGLDLVTSLVLHRDGAIVACAPEILFLRDTDGDGTADAREVLFTGFGFGDTHAVISNLRWGVDGWIYGTQGYSGGASRQVRNAAGVDFGHIGNGVFRFRPDGSAIEVVASYGSNTWGLDFDAEGELFFTMANGAHLRHVVLPERVLRGARLDKAESWTDVPDHDRVVPLTRETEPAYVQIDFVGGFTAASGCTLYTGGAWPEVWNGAHFVSEPTVNLLHHDVLSPRGVTFRAAKEREAEFLAGTDRWFRPVHARVGPDGALYVLDFYNQAVVHNDTRGPRHGPTNAAERPDRDRTHGRIWRLQHRAPRPMPSVELAASADAGDLGRALAHPNRWQRLTAQRRLVERGSAGEIEALRSASRSPEPLARIHALWALEELGALSADEIAVAVADADPGVQRNAIRLAAASSPAHAHPAVESGLIVALSASAPRTRLEALAALGERGPSQAVAEAVVRHWTELDDRWSRSAAARVALRQGPELWRALARATTLPADLAAEVVRRTAREASSEDLDGLLESAAALAPRDATGARALLTALAESAPAMIGAGASGARALEALLAATSVPLATSALAVAARLPEAQRPAAAITALSDRLARAVADEAGSPEDRLAALRVLVLLPERRAAAVAAAEVLLQPAVPLPIQTGAAEALGAIDEPAAERALARGFGLVTGSVQERIFERLVARASSAHSLLDAVEAGDVRPGALGPQRAHRLRTHADPGVAERAGARLGRAASGSVELEALIARLLPEVEAPGDPARGREVFATNCASCHSAYGTGGTIGPDVTGMGAHGARELLPVILDPNRSVEAAYSEWIAETHDGEILSGVLARETESSILLRSSAGDHEVERAGLAALVNTGRSVMPSGFEALGAEALRDVIAYLASGTEGFRVLDLEPFVSAHGARGLYDTRRDPNPFRFRDHGIQRVRGVPFELLDARRTSSGNDALVLKGGLQPDWESKTHRPQRVEIPVRASVARVHVLGGIAAWGYPFFRELEPILKWTWRYADGSSEEVVLRNGVEFADWIGRHDVPGSEFVEDVLADGSWGQVRTFALAPGRAVEVASIVLESYDNRFAPTIVALTAELPGAPPRAPQTAARESAAVVLLGGGSSHDFGRWFDREDRAILGPVAGGDLLFTSSTTGLARRLSGARVLVLSTNLPIAEEDRRAIEEFVGRGGGLLLLHAGTWRNWADWAAHAALAAGGATSHEPFGAFDVEIADASHPIVAGVPRGFRIEDELYRFEIGAQADVRVLASGRSLGTGAEFPLLLVHAHGGGQIVVFTLGHDGRAHEHPAFRTLLQNAVRHLLKP